MTLRSRHRSRIGLAVAVIALVVVVGFSAGCTSDAIDDAGELTLHASETVVRDLIELRRAGSVDADAYAQALETTSIITTLVGDTVEGEPAVPVSGDVFLYTLTDDRAEVVVVWGDSEGFDDWPVATAFLVHRTDAGEWRVADALPLGAETVPDAADAVREPVGVDLRLFTN